MSSLKCRPVALLLLALHLGACTTWQPTTLSPAQVIEEEEASTIRVTRSDGTQLTLDKPFIQNDSLAAREQTCRTTVRGRTTRCEETARIVLPLGEVAQLEVRRESAGRSAAVALTSASVILAAFFLYLSWPDN